MASVGEQAPNFTLKNCNKQEVSIRDYHGKQVIIAFYPAAFSGVCDTELCRINDNMKFYESLNTEVIGISVDAPWSNKAFSEKYGLSFELLSDYERKVITSYDVIFEGLGGLESYISANRAVFILNNEGKITYKWVAPNPGVEPDYDEIKSLIEN